MERDQHARFEAVHVLRRHRRDDGHAGEVVAAERGGETPRFGPRIGDQQAPGLGVRQRIAGRTGGEHVGGHQAAGDGRDLVDRRGRCCTARMPHRRQAVIVGAAFDECVDAREARTQPRDGLGDVVGRQEAGVAAQQRSAETDRKAVAVGREVEHGSGMRQPLGKRRRIGDVLAPRQRLAAAVGEGRVEVAGADQADVSHASRGRAYARTAWASVARSNSGCRR